MAGRSRFPNLGVSSPLQRPRCLTPRVLIRIVGRNPGEYEGAAGTLEVALTLPEASLVRLMRRAPTCITILASLCGFPSQALG